MDTSMKFIDPRAISKITEGSVQGFLDLVTARAERHFSEEEMKVLSIHDGAVTLISESKCKVIRATFTNDGGEVQFGPVEDLDVSVHDSESEWAVSLSEDIADMIGSGASLSDVKPKLLALSESVARGNAYTSEGLLRGLRRKLEDRSSWADVYASRDRDIRGYIKGEIGSLRESMPKKRFRVLATEHAPENPESYREQVVESFQLVLAKYSEVYDRMTELMESVDVDGFVDVDSGVLIQNLSGFVSSLRESAETVSVDGMKFLGLESTSGGLSRLSRLHDLLAEGLEDYLVCSAFSEKLVREIRNSLESQS